MFKLSPEGQEFVKRELTRYETPRSAILPCLYRVQAENGGWVSAEAAAYLARLMDMPEAHINEALSFYTMFNKTPVGKLHVQVCANVSCAMNGGRELAEHICRAFKVQEGEMSKDGKMTVCRVECLGSCDTAPMMQINDRYYENLTKDKAVEIIQKLSQL
jgi:NADH-quinone oxidoreductase subunit E